jgi:hypothetical protein
MSHSLLVAPHERELAAFFLAFGRLEGRGMRREEQGMRLEGGGTAHSLPFAPLERELAAFFLAFGWLEAGGMGREEQGMRREEQGMRREEQGMKREKVFAGHEAASGWEEAGGMRLAGQIARRLAPALFDNRWSKQGGGRAPLPCSHLSSRRPRIRSFAAGTGARAAVPQSLSP